MSNTSPVMKSDCPTPDCSPAHLADALGVSMRTARRWLAAGKMPFAYAVVWQIITEGDLGAVDPAFRGWRLRDGQVWAPEGYGFTAGELRAIPLRAQELAHLRREAQEPRQWLLT